MGSTLSFSLLVSLLFACAPTAHTVQPYASDPVIASLLEQRARAACQQLFPSDNDIPSQPFITDGCSRWFDGNWKQCCVEHDLRYWCGGSASLRKRADFELRSCIDERATGFMAGFMYWTVRLGGHPIFPASYRWGYGRPYSSCYGPAQSTLESIDAVPHGQ